MLCTGYTLQKAPYIYYNTILYKLLHIVLQNYFYSIQIVSKLRNYIFHINRYTCTTEICVLGQATTGKYKFVYHQFLPKKFAYAH